MICEKFEKLHPMERVKMVGEIVHALQTDPNTFDKVVSLIEAAKKKGIFDNVTIMPIGELSRSDEPRINEIP